MSIFELIVDKLSVVKMSVDKIKCIQNASC